jgi:hypothetical protein
MAFFYSIRNVFQDLVIQNALYDVTVDVRVKTLRPEEAIGYPEHQVCHLINGRERMLEAEFLGSRGQAFTDMYGSFSGTLAEVCATALTDNYQRAVFLASLNAVARHLGFVEKTVHCGADRPPRCADRLVSYVKEDYGHARVALVGFRPRLVVALAQEFELRVTDRDPNNVGQMKYGIRIGGPMQTAENLAWCDVALVTGATLTNDSIRELLLEKPTVFCGVTIAAAAHFLNLTRFCPYGT